MVNVLKFPDRSNRINSQEFLQDGDDILCFESSDTSNAEWEASSPTIKKSPFPFSENLQSKDWTNQELADLFRVKRLLEIAGFLSDTERGMTDEGDPWFVFCDTKGEVFIHLCRVDGDYILDSPNISGPLHGKNFKDLINSFTQKKFLAQNETKSVATNGHRVVALNRNGKVFIHPSTMLAALVWTLLLSSEEIVMVLPEDTDDLVDGVDGLISVSEDVTRDIDPNAAEAWNTFEAQPAEALGLGLAADATVQSSEDFLSSDIDKLSQNSYAISLSVVAISLGFMSEAIVSDFDDNTLEILNTLSALGETDESYQLLEKASLGGNAIHDFLNAMIEFSDPSYVLADAKSETANAKIDNDVEGSNLFSAKEENSASTSKVTADVEPNPSLRDAELDLSLGIDLNKTENGFGDKKQPIDPVMTEETDFGTVVYDAGAQDSTISLLDKVSSLSLEMKEYNINDMKVAATFDVDASELSKTTSLISTSETASKNNTHQSLDDNAFDWINHFVNTTDDIEIISLEGELILFDLSVLNAEPEDTMIMSWSLENGDVITVAGLGSEYDAFNLIA